MNTATMKFRAWVDSQGQTPVPTRDELDRVDLGQPPANKTAGDGNVYLVLGILGFFTFGITWVILLIMVIIDVVKVKDNKPENQPGYQQYVRYWNQLHELVTWYDAQEAVNAEKGGLASR